MPALLRLHLDTTSRSTWNIAGTLCIAATLACLTTPSQHALLVQTTTWAALCLACTTRTGLTALLQSRPGQAAAYGAGFLLAIAQLCERAAGAQNLWWAHALVPAVLYFVHQLDLGSDGDEHEAKEPNLQPAWSWSGIGFVSVCALAASYRSTGSNTSVALGLSHLVVCTVALFAIQHALKETSGRRNGSIIYSTSGGIASQSTQPSDRQESVVLVVRDISVAAGLICGITAIAWESWRFDGLTQWGLLGRVLGDSWIPGQSILSFLQATIALLAQFVFMSALVLMVHRQTILTTSFVLMGGFTLASVLANFTLLRLWFFCLATVLLMCLQQDVGSTSMLRPTRIIMIVISLSAVAMLGLNLRARPSIVVGVPLGYNLQEPSAPVQLTDSTVHPIAQLTRSAQAEWAQTIDRQSKTLDAAVAEYRRRYKMSPPPNFDKWFEFARTRNVQMIDEFDTIYHSLLPFWALSPATIRARAREAIGHSENKLLALLLRDGKAVRVEGGDDWQQRATVGLVEHFTQFLPDMDLAFNIHDEPRVALSSAGLDRLVAAGLHEIASTSSSLQNAFSSRPADISPGQRIEEVKTTKFNYFPHQQTWESAKVSCAADTPVGSLQEAADDLSTYALGDLGFIYNRTGFTDICNSPSLEASHGFFERANAFSVTHDLFPIFSQSKMSSFQDITYPSPWYWYDKAPYFDAMDMEWEKKENKMWWRGSTTGGYTQDGGWRRQHRQQLVRKINAPDRAKIMTPGWSLADTDRQDYKDLFDVHFTSISQCDAGDCAAQKDFFTLAPKADQQESWKSKYLLDMDGNAYSGRFYALLKSHSLVFKMAVFREWHEDWIKPWVHYIPLSLRGDEILEAVRYIDAEPEGQDMGSGMAQTSSEWANSALRKEDFEAWFFRLLLEYGRLVDDDRSKIGFT